ncbi:1094_t:CDS:2 [Ambispora gerdemannii]|uniref:1094_t:CDS:1 n=1 Tax=Ambispora gerdemannii TaxID=144530 RepID=A0A9N8Z528_9GLOM|nr:1094_t:CDS:2 [Ambispora gerdemannii]
MLPARIAEEILEESNKEKNNINDIIHTITITEYSNSKVEHISNTLQIETHLLVHSDIVIIQNKTAKEMADLIIIKVEDKDDYSWK